MIHQYEIDFSVMYGDKVTDLQSVIIPAHSLEEAKEKLKLEGKRRFGTYNVKIATVSLYVSENVRYVILI
ncbi:Phage protein [Bacillus pseudomycoides]